MTRTILMADMQSFYASIEKANHPEWEHLPVVVSGDPAKRSGIILAACPLAKKRGVKATEPLWMARQKCPEAIVVKPRMQLYIDMAATITDILENFSNKVEVFSVDEQFIDITESVNLFGEPHQIAQAMQKEIKDTTGIYARVGIASNKFLAKMACDAFAKKKASGIFHLENGQLQDVLWPLSIGEMFGVGSRMKKHFDKLGIQTIGQLARFPVSVLKKRWGINGELLWRLANGIDPTPVTPETHQYQKAIGHNMTLPHDYETFEDIKVILLELSEEVARRARRHGYLGSTVTLGVRGVDFKQRTGFYRQMKLLSPTDFGMDLFKAAVILLKRHWDGMPIRSASITLSQLESAKSRQMNLFDEPFKKEGLNQALDHIYKKYGPTAMFRASSLTRAGQVHERAQKIGGHYK